MIAAHKKFLRRAWFGVQTLDRIAVRYGLTADAVQKFWQREKAVGRLPAGPRPHFVENSAGVTDGAAIDAAADPVLMQQIDRSERTWESAEDRSRRACEESLAALRAAHPDLDNAAAQTVAPHIAALDAGKNLFFPSQAWLIAHQRACDAKRRPRA